MDQSPAPNEETRKGHEQHVSFQSPHYGDHMRNELVDEDVYEEDEEEDIDENEEQRIFEQRLFDAQQRNQDERSNPVSVKSPLSPPDSMDSGDFVKLEKPKDLFESTPRREFNVNVQNKEEITPSDEVEQPFGEDMKDFARSPQEAAHGLAADRAHETLEQFLTSTGESSGRVGRDFTSTMHRADERTTYGGHHRVMFEDEDEDTFRRQGPLTVGQPVTEVNLRHDANDGLVDGSEPPSLAQHVKWASGDAAAAVGEFASKITQDAKEGAFKAKEVVQHGASQAKEVFQQGATHAKEAVEDLLGLNEEEQGRISPGSPDWTPPGNASVDQPDTPIFIAAARPPTPPKPRAEDAPETPPILDLGGPAHPHTHNYTPYQRKPSLKISSMPVGFTSPGSVSFGSVSASKGPSLLDFRGWDNNVLDLIYWRDARKSGVVFGVTLTLLLCLATFNVISVVSYVSLLVLMATLGFRVYNTVVSTVQKNEQKNPFQPYLEQSLDFPQDRVHEQVDVILKHANDMLHQLRRLFLVEDFFETLKFALLLWALTYVGAYFSGTALIILAFVGLFTLPKVYELYQPQIDNYYGIAEAKVKQASSVARDQLDKVPFFKKEKPLAKEE